MTILQEIEAADLSALHARTPYVITGVQHTQFSIARHYGGMRYQGDRYTYVPDEDLLVRRDVMQHLEKTRKTDRRVPDQASLLDESKENEF